MIEKIKEAIDAIRPALQNDGGDISLERVEGKNVHVKLHGHCAGCPMSQITLSNGVERYLRDTVDPELNVINDDMVEMN
ncbi:MAG: NifU family protein [Spirochaetales bacterium]|nr:NifU family protein [Candidatus Physcosoma equi]